MNTFRELGIPTGLVKSLEEMGIVTPTEVQTKFIPFLMKNGGDFCA